MIKWLALNLVLGMAVWCAAQSGGNYQEPQHQPVKIIHGPVVEFVTDSTAQIAWSTNENSGTVVHYGTDPNNLSEKATMPWGGLTHRVLLRHLRSNTTYYFKTESADGQDTGTRAEAQERSFTTK
jgi:Purple acid Phosphatase, N-terminal domain